MVCVASSGSGLKLTCIYRCGNQSVGAGGGVTEQHAARKNEYAEQNVAIPLRSKTGRMIFFFFLEESIICNLVFFIPFKQFFFWAQRPIYFHLDTYGKAGVLALSQYNTNNLQCHTSVQFYQ
jgi:hypothetical protein